MNFNLFDEVFNYSAQKPVFKDIRNQRYSVAEEKARLVHQLHDILKRVPDQIRNGDIKLVREWRAHWDTANKVCGNTRSSVQQLQTALKQMKHYYEGAAK